MTEREKRYMEKLLAAVKTHPFDYNDTDVIIEHIGEYTEFLGEIDAIIYNLEHKLDVPYEHKCAYIKHIKKIRNDFLAEFNMPTVAKKRVMKRIVKTKGSR